MIGFLIWGLSIGQLYQDVYARSWRIHVGTAADQVLFTIWFFVFSGVIALMTVSASELRAAGWLALLPVWIAGSMIFWLWTPRFLLHRKISPRSLLPGALLATFLVGGTIATSPLWIGPTLNQNAKAFGSFGVVHRPLRLHPDRRHHLDGLCRLRSRLGRMAPGRAGAKGRRTGPSPCRAQAGCRVPRVAAGAVYAAGEASSLACSGWVASVARASGAVGGLARVGCL